MSKNATATELAISRLQRNRRVRQKQLLTKLQTEDARTDHTLQYVGSIRGQHYGLASGGGMMPIEPSSNGSIPSMGLISATVGRSANQAIGLWMPR